MSAALSYLTFAGALIAAVSAGYRFGYRRAARKFAPPSPLTWQADTDRALQAFNDAAGRVSPAEWQDTQRRANRMRNQLRHRRDRIN